MYGRPYIQCIFYIQTYSIVHVAIPLNCFATLFRWWCWWGWLCFSVTECMHANLLPSVWKAMQKCFQFTSNHPTEQLLRRKTRPYISFLRLSINHFHILYTHTVCRCRSHFESLFPTDKIVHFSTRATRLPHFFRLLGFFTANCELYTFGTFFFYFNRTVISISVF